MKKSKSPSIAYYVSAHGYGHGVRSCSIIKAINASHPHWVVHVISALPESFLSAQIDLKRNPLRADSFDVGMAQIDSIRVDVPSTLAKMQQLYSRRDDLVKREAAFLQEKGMDVVVVDIPAIPIDAAAKIGIPRLAVGNFAWDWIYSEFITQDAGWKPIVDTLSEQYSQTDLLLRLPFCEEMRAFPRIEDIPLVAGPGKNRRAEIAALTRCDPGKKWILLSFTNLEWPEDSLANVEQIQDYEFFAVDPLQWQKRNIHTLDRSFMAFADILASVDAVISKPGFGILSDCIANGKPLVYADRSNFREYPVLVDAIRKYIRHVHIPAEELYRGNLAESLSSLWKSPAPSAELALGGDRIATQHIGRYIG